MIKRPMLACSQACTEGDLQRLQYPVIVSEKLDGIRCLLLCKDGKLQAFSRKLIPIPNCHIHAWAEKYGIAGMDGELVVESWTYNEIQSKVMSNVTFPFPFAYQVFDHVGYRDLPFLQRLQTAKNLIERYTPLHMDILPHASCNNPKEVMRYYNAIMDTGGEGIIINSPSGIYKQGRSTFNEQLSLKMKPFEDAEAEVIGFEEAQENLNTKTIDNTGYSKRSSHRANRRGKDYLGVLIGRDLKTGEIIRVGSGFDRETANHVWQNRGEYSGKIFTYKFQAHGTKDKPRTPIFKGFRRD